MVGYLERRAGGLLITRARLLGDGWSGEWRAPASTPPDDGASASAPGDAALDSARAAAAWIAQQLGVRRERALDTLVVDTDGAMCLWLGAPSDDPRVVAAALLQGGSRSDHDAVTGHNDAVMFAAAEGLGTERSIQAARPDDEPEAPAASRSLLSRRGGAATAEAPRQRMAIMSVPDAAVRVVLDTLDTAGIAVESVTSLWHAAAKAWDPSSAPRTDAGGLGADRFAAESSPTSAVVLVDPVGRLLWCWTRQAKVLACGSMLLRRVEVGAGVAALLEPGGPDTADPGSLAAVECSEAEASRLCVDWLGWSAQLGVNPDRIVYVGPPSADGPGPAFAQAIGQRWPGAFVDAATDEDPVGTTLARTRTSVPWADADLAVADGRRALVDLSQRPGRAHRSYYHWIAGAVAAAAVVVAALGWKMRSAAGEAQAQLDAFKATRTEALKSLEARIPGLSSQPDPVGRIRGFINELRARAERVRPEVPLMDEFQRIVSALADASGAKVTLIDLTNVTAMVKLNVPDADTGPRVTDKINQLPGQLDWTGASSGATGAPGGRSWTLTGQWNAAKPRAGSGGAQ